MLRKVDYNYRLSAAYLTLFHCHISCYKSFLIGGIQKQRGTYSPLKKILFKDIWKVYAGDNIYIDYSTRNHCCNVKSANTEHAFRLASGMLVFNKMFSLPAEGGKNEG